MKILLVNAPPKKFTGVTGQLYPPLGLLYIAAYVRDKIEGLHIRVMDGYLEKNGDIEKESLEFKPDIIGISFATQSATGAYELSHNIRKLDKKVLIVAGGPHSTALPEEVLHKSSADIVATGEGEETFLEIVKRVKDGAGTEGIAGTLTKKGSEIFSNRIRPLISDINSVPWPARDLINLKKYHGFLFKDRDITVLSSRGCPHECVYCANAVWNHAKPRFRTRSPEKFVDELESLVIKSGINKFFDISDEFNTNLKWAQEVCREITKRRLKISLRVQLRVDNLDEETVKLMKEAGMGMVYLGIESGNQRTLDGILKKQTLEQADHAMALLKKYRIKSIGLFMFLNVWEEKGILRYENKDDSTNTLRYISRLVNERMITYFHWSITTPYPGSRLYDIALKHNIIDQDFVENWELFDNGINFAMKLPGIRKSDWIVLLKAGRKIQTSLFIRSGICQFRKYPLYIKKMFYIFRRIVLKK